MRVLLTGATGYVGRQVLPRLLRRGHQVVGLVRAPERVAALPAGAEPLVADLADVGAIAAGDVDAVVHTGFVTHGGDWFAAVAVEHRLIAGLVEALKYTGKTLIVSNGTAFLGDSGEARLDETAPVPADHPAGVRARSTAQATDAAADGLRGIEIRLASFVYGHGGSVFLPILVNAARRTGRSIYVGDGAFATSAVHVEAAADAYVAALEDGEAGATYHIASDEEPRIRDIAQAVAIGVGGGCTAAGVSAEAASDALDPFTAMFLGLNNRLDSRRARCSLRWTPAGHPPLLWDVAFGSYVRG